MDDADRGTMARRKKDVSFTCAYEHQPDPIQLYRPQSSEDKSTITAMVNSANLTEKDIEEFLSTGTLSNIIVQGGESENDGKYRSQMLAFESRKKQIREWAKLVESGGAHFDPQAERLVPMAAADPNHQMPPIPLQPPPANNDIGENEDEERRWLEHEEREASEAIARAVRRYQQLGVPEDEYELIALMAPERDAVNLTCRRICFAVLAVSTAFICIMLQTMPLLHTVSPTNQESDKLLSELVHVRELHVHAKECSGLNRDEGEGWRIWKTLGLDLRPTCADGVLHLPALSALHMQYRDHSSNSYDAYKGGLNISWFLPCHAPSDEAYLSSAACYRSLDDEVCSNSTNSCFRGVHDGVVSPREVTDALHTAAYLISVGGDHVEIHYDVKVLNKQLPSVVTKLRLLLQDGYGVSGTVHPIAFRISAAMPMDATGINLYSRPADLLSGSFNRTTYIDWLEAVKHQNEVAAFPLPPPFAKKSFRDPCRLLADQEADPNFAIHTSVFLSDGAGEDFSGGSSLYVDYHRSNSNPRRRIRRGITVDGSRGRVVVSSGGEENRRCRLPTRSGVRAVLQIWWACE